MSKYDAYRVNTIAGSYRNSFFRSVFAEPAGDLEPLIWCKKEGKIEIFTTEAAHFLDSKFVAYFHELQSVDNSTVWIYSSKALNVKEELFKNTHVSYTKLTYYNNNRLLFKGSDIVEKKLTVVHGRDEELEKKIKGQFIEDSRLYRNDSRMKPVYGALLDEFDQIANQCEHLYLLSGLDLVGYVSGKRLAADLYGYPFYLIALVWLEEKTGSNIKHEAVFETMSWLNDQGAPFYSAINYSNTDSLDFFTNNCFMPFTARFIPWPMLPII